MCDSWDLDEALALLMVVLLAEIPFSVMDLASSLLAFRDNTRFRSILLSAIVFFF